MAEIVASSRRDLLALAALVFLPAFWVGVCISKEKFDAVVAAAAGQRAHGEVLPPEGEPEARELDPATKNRRSAITRQRRLDAIDRAPEPR
jgi:hypothetical protein